MPARSPNVLVLYAWIVNCRKLVCVHYHSDMDDGAHRHTSTGNITSILVPRRQRRTPPTELLSILPDPDFWLWLYNWEPFLDSTFQDDCSKGPAFQSFQWD